MYCSISDLAADTQCSLASSLKAFQNLALTYQRAGPFIFSFAAKCLTHQYAKEVTAFPAKENKIGADTYLVECYYQQVFIFHTLPMPQAYTRSSFFLFFIQNTVQPLIISTACNPNSPNPNVRKINLLAKMNKNKHKMLLYFSYSVLKTMKSKIATGLAIW